MQKRLEPGAPPLFLDRNIDSLDICAILTKIGISVRRHKDHFTPEEDDDVWIAEVSKRKWAILSADKNIEKDHLEAVVQNRAKLILLIGQRSGAIQWASSVVVAQEKLLKLLQENEGPLVIRLGRSGEIKVRLKAEVSEKRRRVETTKVTREKRHAR